MPQVKWSEEARRNRACVDAVRVIIGLDPLYNQTRTPDGAWLMDVSVARQAQRQGRTATRGAPK